MRFDILDLHDAAPVGVRWLRPDGGYHREVLEPGDDLDAIPENARNQITAHWTPERVAAWQAINEEP